MAHKIVDQNGAFMAFSGHSSAGNSTITTFAGASVEIEEDSTMANATLIIDGGIVSAKARSTGGEGRVELTQTALWTCRRISHPPLPLARSKAIAAR